MVAEGPAGQVAARRPGSPSKKTLQAPSGAFLRLWFGKYCSGGSPDGGAGILSTNRCYAHISCSPNEPQAVFLAYLIDSARDSEVA